MAGQIGPVQSAKMHDLPQVLSLCYWESVRCDADAEEEAKCLIVPGSGEGPRPASLSQETVIHDDVVVGLVRCV